MSEASTVAALVREGVQPIPMTVTPPEEGKVPVLLIPQGSGHYSVQSVKKYFDEYRTAPERREGTATMTDLDSFIDHVNRFKNSHSAIFLCDDADAPSLLAVLDYHEAVNAGEQVTPDAQPKFCKHRTRYNFPLSKEWQTWMNGDGQEMTQGEFARFIEDRILDILTSPTFQGDLSEDDEKLKKLAALLHGKFAGPEKLMSLSRSFAVLESSKVVSVNNLSSGEYSIVYQSEHTDETGEKIDVPNLFLIGIPVFKGGAFYRITVRLRYRKKSGGVVWFFEVFDADKVLDDALTEASHKVAGETGLPCFAGKPENRTEN